MTNKRQHEELQVRLAAIESKPGKKWESATWIIITGNSQAQSRLYWHD